MAEEETKDEKLVRDLEKILKEVKHRIEVKRTGDRDAMEMMQDLTVADCLSPRARPSRIIEGDHNEDLKCLRRHFDDMYEGMGDSLEALKRIKKRLKVKKNDEAEDSQETASPQGSQVF